MKKTFTRMIAAVVLAAGFTTMAQAQSLTMNTYNKLDFTKVTAKTTNVRLLRYLYAGYNTICLPFSVSADELTAVVGDGVMLEKLAKAEGTTLTFLDVTKDGIEAGMPYLLYSPKKQSVAFKSSDASMTTEPITLTVGKATMSGKYEPTKQNNLLGIPAQQDCDLLQSVLVRTTGDKTFLPTRCGISYECDGVPTIKHVTSIEDETAIAKLQAVNATVDVYTVNGQLVKKGVRINEAQSALNHGIYVVNGQKFMVK